MINIGEEKGAWFRIVSDLEIEITLLKKINSEKESTITNLKYEVNSIRDQLDNEKKKSDQLQKKLAAAAKPENGSRENSRSSTPSPEGGASNGAPVSRSQEIEAWMDMCNSLSLSKPVFSGSGAIHSTTLKSVVDSVKQFRIKEVGKEKDLEQLRLKIKELEDSLVVANSKANSPASAQRKKSAHFGDGDESLPPGFAESEGDNFYGGGGAGRGRSRSTIQATSRAEVLAAVWADSMLRLTLSMVSDKIDFACSSTQAVMGEPRWRGPKHGDGARWIGTWDSVMAADQQLNQQQQQQQNQQIPQQPQVLQQQQQQQGQYPGAEQYFMMHQQEQQRGMMMMMANPGQSYPQASSANINNQRTSSPTNWRRVLDSHLNGAQNMNNNNNNSRYGSPSNHSGGNAVLIPGGYQQEGRLINNNPNGSGYSPHRSSSTNLQTGHHNSYMGPSGAGHQQMMMMGASNGRSISGMPLRNSPPRSTTPLGASQTIRQILEKMQAERNSFARSRSGSPGYGGNNPDMMYSGQQAHLYPFVNRAIRRSQSPPNDRNGGIHQTHGGYQQLQKNGSSGARVIGLPPGFGVMTIGGGGGGGGRSSTPNGVGSRRY